MVKSLALIGAGQMGAALLRGVLNARLYEASSVTAVEADPTRLRAVVDEFGVQGSRSAAEAARSATVVLLAVKPGQVRQVLEEIGPGLRSEQIVASIAAGVTLTSLRGWVGEKPRLVRVMPNSPALIGKAVSAIAVEPGTPKEAIEITEEIFSAVGETVSVEEGLLDAVTALSGSGPAYVYLFAEALVDAGVGIGLSRELATQLAYGTVAGSAAMLTETGKHPADLRAMVSSPGGTTIAALGALEAGGFRAAVWDGVRAAHQRAKELG